MSSRRALAIALAIAIIAGAGRAATASAARAGTTRSPHPAPGRTLLPDSVLAVVDGDRVVGLARFTRGWQAVKPPARADSLTPQGARRFLDLLVEKELLAAAAERERWNWTEREQAQFDGLRDHLVIQAMLDSATDAVRRDLEVRGFHTRGSDTLGIVARDTAMVRLHASFDDSVCAKLACAWAALPKPTRQMSVFEQLRVLGQMPQVAPADTGRVVARSSEGDYRAADLLHAWYLLNPMYRPRIESASQIRDLAKNGLFERMLRREAARRHVAERPDIAEQLARQRELNDVTHYVDREIGQSIATDSLTLLRYYRQHAELWRLPLRLRYARLVLEDAEAAGKMAVQLRDPGEADSLLAQAHRRGANWDGEVSEQTDSTLFRRLMSAGVGTVLGPEPVQGGWQVTRVVTVVPARDRGFDEVRPLVEHAWTTDEGERRMRGLLAKLRASSRVRINEPALARLVQAPPPGLVGAK